MEAPQEEVDFSEVFSMERIGYNARSLNFCRVFVAIISGMASGILGLEGVVGFLAFLASTFVLSVGLYLRLACDPKPYFKKPGDIWTEGIQQAAMSYVMFWTLFYDVSVILAVASLRQPRALIVRARMLCAADCAHLLSRHARHWAFLLLERSGASRAARCPQLALRSWGRVRRPRRRGEAAVCACLNISAWPCAASKAQTRFLLCLSCIGFHIGPLSLEISLSARTAAPAPGARRGSVGRPRCSRVRPVCPCVPGLLALAHVALRRQTGRAKLYNCRARSVVRADSDTVTPAQLVHGVGESEHACAIDGARDHAPAPPRATASAAAQAGARAPARTSPRRKCESRLLGARPLARPHLGRGRSDAHALPTKLDELFHRVRRELAADRPSPCLLLNGVGELGRC